jgi:hypothetical protein
VLNRRVKCRRKTVFKLHFINQGAPAAGSFLAGLIDVKGPTPCTESACTRSPKFMAIEHQSDLDLLRKRTLCHAGMRTHRPMRFSIRRLKAEIWRWQQGFKNASMTRNSPTDRFWQIRVATLNRN